MRYLTITVRRIGHPPQVEHATCLCDGEHHNAASRARTVQDLLTAVERRIPATELESITIVFSRTDPIA